MISQSCNPYSVNFLSDYYFLGKGEGSGGGYKLLALLLLFRICIRKCFDKDNGCCTNGKRLHFRRGPKMVVQKATSDTHDCWGTAFAESKPSERLRRLTKRLLKWGRVSILWLLSELLLLLLLLHWSLAVLLHWLSWLLSILLLLHHGLLAVLLHRLLSH